MRKHDLQYIFLFQIIQMAYSNNLIQWYTHSVNGI